ncbi:IclR family transcriptional regulator [Streptomyces sp. SID13726]|uniref:IclR family transcriptional regulator n=1 Tax=Streptomyces sp. SID13726 TaxID=2706058 RepID=UPI0013BCFF8A|nr:IclR family transcriptional regulator [Streptomyces sp. SID13726]NEA98525.1 IclR family transcriptional regulator [Streptomyces sp. SID13726]
MSLGRTAPSGDVRTGTRSVDRALAVLESLARNGEASVVELAGELGVNKTTAWRILQTLGRHRIVEQSDDRGKYRLGAGLLRLAGAAAGGLELLQEARPVCHRLMAATGRTVNLAVRSDSSVFYLDQAADPSAPPSYDRVGRYVPLHTTGAGRVLMAGLDSDGRADLFGVLSRRTGLAPTEKARLREEFARIGELGYTVAANDFGEGLAAVAAPVRDARGDVVAALSVSEPVDHLTEDRVEEVVPLLLAATSEVSHRLGRRRDAGALATYVPG